MTQEALPVLEEELRQLNLLDLVVGDRFDAALVEAVDRRAREPDEPERARS